MMHFTKAVVFKNYRASENNKGIPKESRRITLNKDNIEITKDGNGQLLPGHNGKVTCFAWSPDGQLLLTASVLSSSLSVGSEADMLGIDRQSMHNTGAVARVWDVVTLEAVKDLVYHDTFGCPRAMQAAAWTPDSRMLALGSEDYFISLWDGITLDLMQLLEGHSNSILCLSWSPNGDYLLSGSDDRHLILWDRESLMNPTVLCHGTSDYDGNTHPENGSFEIVEGEDYKVYDCKSTVLTKMQEPVSVTAWKPGGTKFCAGSNYLRKGKLSFWQSQTKAEIKEIEQQEEIVDISWASQSERVAVTHKGGKIILWNPSTYEQIASLQQENKSTVLVSAWLPDQRLLTAAVDGSIEVWVEENESSNWVTTTRISSNNGVAITTCQVHPNGNDFVIGGNLGEVSLLRLDKDMSKSRVRWIEGHGKGGVETALRFVFGRFMCPCAV